VPFDLRYAGGVDGQLDAALNAAATALP